jgi:alkylated DNA repair dioxygenase AlkB
VELFQFRLARSDTSRKLMKRKLDETTAPKKKTKQTTIYWAPLKEVYRASKLDNEGSFVHNCKHFLTLSESQDLMTELMKLNFQKGNWELYPGKVVATPRLITTMKDNIEVPYGDRKLDSTQFTQEIKDIASKIEKYLQNKVKFNFVLLNLYRNGEDHIAWHADREATEEGKNVIASLTLGETRRFLLRNNKSKEIKEFSLHAGSLLIMEGNTQMYWQHSVPKQLKVQSPRLNLTFRVV